MRSDWALEIFLKVQSTCVSSNLSILKVFLTSCCFVDMEKSFINQFPPPGEGFTGFNNAKMYSIQAPKLTPNLFYWQTVYIKMCLIMSKLD